jgi:hypothetical protein
MSTDFTRDSSGVLIISIKQKASEQFYTATILVFYLLLLFITDHGSRAV